jgi:single-strand DNA-binding protein
MLKIIFIGNLGSDPESRFTQKGSEIVSFRVAVNGRRPGADGEWQDHTDWFRVRVGGRQIDYVKRLGKGSRVHVLGNLEIGSYTAKDTGELRTTLDVYADEVTNLSSRDESPNGGAPVMAARPARLPVEDTDVEDLPF